MTKLFFLFAGVENDKMGYGKSTMMHTQDTPSAVAGLTRSGSDIMNKIHGTNRTSHDEPDDMSTFVKNGMNSLDGVKRDAFESMHHFEEKVEDTMKTVKTGSEDLMHKGANAVEDVSDSIEEQINKAAESVMSKVEDLKEDVQKSLDSTKSKESEMKEDVDKKIDDLLANIEEGS